MEYITGIGEAFSGWMSTGLLVFTGKTLTEGQRNALLVFFIFLILGVLALLVWGFAYSKGTAPKTNDPARIGEVLKSRDRMLTTANFPVANKPLFGTVLLNVPESERYLVNLAPLTASLGGYLGPVSEGVFDAPKFFTAAFKAGFRSFIVPISVHMDISKDTTSWPQAGYPGIMMRSQSGDIISLNGLTVKKFMESLLVANSENPVLEQEPILVTFLETPGYIPDKVKEEDKYARLLTDIGRELKSVGSLQARRLVTLGQYGSAVGAQREAEILLQTPLSQLQNKILFFTDFDISVMQKPAYKGKAEYQDNLYDFVNFQVKVPTSDEATVRPGAAINTKSISIGDISGSKVPWVDQARTVWHTTLRDPLETVSKKSLVELVLTKGIQGVPLPFLAYDAVSPTPDSPATDVRACMTLWGGAAWRLKPAAARYTKPAPVQPATPSARLNARVAPNLQPGQTSIS